MKGMLKKTYNCEIKDINEEERSLVAYASTEDVDRDGEVLLAAGASLDAYRKNPVVMWAHDYRRTPVGKALWIKQDERGLLFKPQFARTQFADEVYQLFKDGYLRAFSVGFIPGEWDNKILKSWELLEVSAVPVPANPEALVTAVNEGRIKSEALVKALSDHLTPAPHTSPRPSSQAEGEIGSGEEVCGATPFADLPAAPEGAAWEWNADVQDEILGDKDNPDWTRYQKAHFWFDPENKESKAGYKLPFARIVEGQLKAVWRGTAAAMAALQGARGGVDIPDEDRKPVWNHISRYYAKFDKEPPELRAVFATEEDLDALLERQFMLEEKVLQLEEKFQQIPFSVEGEGKRDILSGITAEEAASLVAEAVRGVVRKAMGKMD